MRARSYDARKTDAAERPPDPLIVHPRSVGWAASASGVDTFDLCQRKWGWKKIDGIEGAENEFAAFGTAVHATLEHYYVNGTPIPTTEKVGKVAMSGLHFLPQPGMALIEHVLTMQMGGITWTGKIDILSVESALPDVAGVPGRPLVLDHKTTGNLAYAKTRQTLETNDVQAALYGTYAAQFSPDGTVALRWVYYHRNPPFKAVPVDGLSTPQNRAPTLARAVDTAKRQLAILADSSITTARQLPPSTDACTAFGGCKYRAQCGDITPQERFRQLTMSQSIPDPMAALANLQAQVARVNPPPPAGPPPAAFGPPGPPGPPPQYSGHVPPAFSAPAGPPPAQYSPPPAAFGPPQTPPAAPPPPVQPLPPGVIHHTDGKYYQQQQNGAWGEVSIAPPQGPPPGPPPGPAPGPAPTEAAPVKRGRGRPPKNRTIDGNATVPQGAPDDDDLRELMIIALEGAIAALRG